MMHIGKQGCRLLLLLGAVTALAAAPPPAPASAPPACRELEAEAWRLLQAKRFAESAARLEQAIRGCPDEPRYKLAFTVVSQAYGQELIRGGRAEQAIPILRRGLQVNPQSSVLCEMLGTALEATNELAAAIEAWETAKRLGSINPNLEEYLARSRRALRAENGFAVARRFRFLIKYEGEKRREDAAQQVLEILDQAYRDVGQTFQCWPERQLPVILYGSAQYQFVTGQSDWNSGTFDGTIRIRLPADKLDVAALTDTLYHEYTHALLFDIYGAKLPRWVHEGLAQNSRPALPLPAAILKIWNNQDPKKLVPPWDMDTWFNSTNYETMRQAYLETQFFFRFLLDRYQPAGVHVLLGEFGKKQEFSDITIKLYNLTPEGLYQDWLDSPFAPAAKDHRK